MPKLIIICGLPGTGKTTLANELSKKLKLFCLHKDSVKESLYDSLKMRSLNDSKILGLPSVKTILDLAEENIGRGVSVIIESPFNFENDRDIFEAFKRKYSVEIYTIILQLEATERKKRFLERERHTSHHDEQRERQYAEAESTYTHMPEPRLFLDSKNSVKELLKETLDFIY